MNHGERPSLPDGIESHLAGDANRSVGCELDFPVVLGVLGALGHQNKLTLFSEPLPGIPRVGGGCEWKCCSGKPFT